MLLRLGLLGTIRPRPIQALRRAWLWLTAPAPFRERFYSGARGSWTQIRSLSDVELACMINIGVDVLRPEALRRGLEIEPSSLWVETAIKMWPDLALMRLCEKILRP